MLITSSMQSHQRTAKFSFTVLPSEEPVCIPLVSVSKVIILQLYGKLLLCNNKADPLHFSLSAVVKTELGRDHSQLLSSFCSPFSGAAGILLITRQSKVGFSCSFIADSLDNKMLHSMHVFVY